jgi:hypothetical protein
MEQDNSEALNPILCFNFNQDASCFCLGTITGFSIFNSSPFQLLHSKGKIILK